MNSKLWVIGLAGTNGSGKDTAGQILANYYKYMFMSVTELLRKEAIRRNLPVEREFLRNISAQWRRELGLGVLVDKAVADYETVKQKYVGLAIASLRNPGEADRIHELGGLMIWIDADPKIRYRRVQANLNNRDRKSEDNKTFEEFMAEEEAEMISKGDSATLNMSAVKTKCDLTIDNSDEDLNVFKDHIESALNIKAT